LMERDVRIRYKQTLIGCLWAVIQPVTTMLVFTVIFGRWIKVPTNGAPYPLFVYAAILPWTFFANTVADSANSVLASSSLITKIYFPRLVIPMASIGLG